MAMRHPCEKCYQPILQMEELSLEDLGTRNRLAGWNGVQQGLRYWPLSLGFCLLRISPGQVPGQGWVVCQQHSHRERRSHGGKGPADKLTAGIQFAGSRVSSFGSGLLCALPSTVPSSSGGKAGSSPVPVSAGKMAQIASPSSAFFT